jgi:hypothetical protein
LSLSFASQRPCTGSSAARRSATFYLPQPASPFTAALITTVDRHYPPLRNKVFIVDKKHRRVGFRTTIEGRFKSKMNLHCFPFDVQALKISVMLGVEASTGAQLFEHHARFEQDPFHANLILYQIDSEYDYLPLRFETNHTHNMETDNHAHISM